MASMDPDEPPPLVQCGPNHVRHQGRRLLYFSGCDYYRTSRHPKVVEAAHRALDRYGLNVAASRMTTGNHPLYEQLEAALQDFFDADSALLLASGYSAPATVAHALRGSCSVAFIDEGAHAALLDASQVLGCQVKPFKHRDPNSLADLVRRLKSSCRAVVLTDGLFSGDGTAAPLSAYLEVLPQSGFLVVDDAHGAGVLGANGRGTPEHEGVNDRRVIQCITLSKAFGAYGGAVLCSRPFRIAMVKCSRNFAGSTPIPLPLAAAAIAGIKLLQNTPQLRVRLRTNTLFLRKQLRSVGLPVEDTPGPIVSLQNSGESSIDRIAKGFLDAGIYPPVTRYLGGCARVRFVVSSAHTVRQIGRAITALRKIPGLGSC